jgi:5-deoxy-glucuronate isomerase
MIIRRNDKPFAVGYTAITEEGGSRKGTSMDFGIIRMTGRGQNSRIESTAVPGNTLSAGKERAFLLMNGRVRFTWSGDEDGSTVRSEECERWNLLAEEPVALHVPARCSITVECLSTEAELALQARSNAKPVTARLWKPGDYRSDQFGEGTMQDTCTRTVRTIFDAATVPGGEMVLGEVINHPGKWSSYPPHDHAQPEIYHYRFFPQHGYGHAELEHEVFKVRNTDSYAIPPGVTHSQCAAPGYVMYYIWAIAHLPGDRFGPDSRVFRKEHEWVMDATAPIWPDAPLDEVISRHR